MVQEDDHHHHHHHNAKPTNFFPMFCRLSLKEIKPQNPAIIISGEPASPRVTCTGQVRRSSRVTGFPSAAGHHRHRKPISTKSLLPNAALAGGVARTSKEMISNKNNYYKRMNATAMVDIGKMDPPLPVKTPPPPPSPEVNLWRRRGRNGGGAGIQRLQIEEIKMGNYFRFGFQSR